MRVNPIKPIVYASQSKKLISQKHYQKPDETLYQPVFNGWIKASLLAPTAAVIGFAVGGPIGAAIGSSIGAGIGAAQDDKNSSDDFDSGDIDYHTYYATHFD